jgi:MFS family permease
MAIDTHIYFLPLYFQSVQGVAASSSGVHLLPYLATMILSAVISGIAVAVFKFYVPFIVAGAAIMTVGSCLIYTLGTHPSMAQWIGYQLLTGIGFGISFQLPYSALPVVLDARDLPIGNSLLIFFQAFGGAVAVSVAQNVFNHSLLERLQALSDIISNPHEIVAAGATRIPSAVAPDLVSH